jgi:hypothetical protein
MRHITSFSIPKPQSLALVADAGPDIPGGEGANKGFWRKQWRDSYKRFVDMGRSVKFKVRLEDGRVVSVVGKFQGSSDAVFGRIYVEGDPNVPDGYYYVTSDNGATVIANLKQEDLDRLGIQPGKDYDGNTVTARDAAATQDISEIKYEPKTTDGDKPATQRKENLSGAEAQERKLSTVTQNLKEQGRFPVPRQTNLQFWGEESDIAKGAKEDYYLVYESLKNQDPSWKEKYPTFDDFWGKVKEMAVGQTSQSPNDLSKIPQEMKDINKAYAERVLNMNPDGKITFYRNAVNRKGSAEDSALGYVTTNADFAYDYNSQAPNDNGNGRYEIDVKPDEVFGMLGYSQLEDEFGVTIGRAVTSQPDRVRRVGDLAQPVLAPWLEKYQDGVGRSTGGTPYRHYALAGQFDLLPVDPLGDTAAEFLGKHGKTAADIKAKFDELYGEGSYEEYKASDESLNFSDIKRLFVDVGDGKVGLDITRIGGMDGSLAPGGYGNGDPASFKNDKTDNTLKMLSVFQELSGQPFMVHRSRTDELPPEVKETATPDVEDSGVSDIPSYRYKDSKTGWSYEDEHVVGTNPNNSPTDGEVDAVITYTGKGYTQMNALARGEGTGDSSFSEEEIATSIENLTDLIDRNPPLGTKALVYRGVYDSKNIKWSELEVGSEFIDNGFVSTSPNAATAGGFGSVQLEIELGEDTKAIDVSSTLDGTKAAVREPEVILQRGTRFEVVAKTENGFKLRVVGSAEPKPLSEPEATPEAEEAPTPEATPVTEEITYDEEQAVKNFAADSFQRITELLLRRDPEVDFDKYLAMAERGDTSDQILIASFEDIDKEGSRALTSKEADAFKQIPKVTSAIAKSSLKEDETLYRGFSMDDQDTFDAWLATVTPGNILKAANFSSTSRKSSIAETFTMMSESGGPRRVLMEIDAPAGTMGLDMNDKDLAEYPEEEEVLLNRNQRFEVVSVSNEKITYEGYEYTVVYVNVKAIGPKSEEEPTLEPVVEEKPEPPKPKAPIPTPVKPLPKVQIKEKEKVDRSLLPMPQVEVNEPVYSTLNKDKPVYINGFIAVPSSAEADELSGIGKDPTKKERDALRKKTLEVLTKTPNYEPLPPELADFEALTSIGESAFTYVDSSLAINDGLRDADYQMENSKQVKDIDKAISLSAHLPPGSTVYRMLKLSTWERLNPQPGQVLIDRAYASTSHTKRFSDEARDIDIKTGDVNQIPMRIVMPNNTSGIDLSTISWYNTEDEYLLPRQTAMLFLGWDSDGYAVFERIS